VSGVRRERVLRGEEELGLRDSGSFFGLLQGLVVGGLGVGGNKFGLINHCGYGLGSPPGVAAARATASALDAESYATSNTAASSDEAKNARGEHHYATRYNDSNEEVLVKKELLVVVLASGAYRYQVILEAACFEKVGLSPGVGEGRAKVDLISLASIIKRGSNAVIYARRTAGTTSRTAGTNLFIAAFGLEYVQSVLALLAKVLGMGLVAVRFEEGLSSRRTESGTEFLEVLVACSVHVITFWHGSVASAVGRMRMVVSSFVVIVVVTRTNNGSEKAKTSKD